VFYNKVQRIIFRPKRKEVAGGLRKLHNLELHNLYALTNIIRVIKSRIIRCVHHAERMGEMRNVYIFLVVKSEKKRKAGRPRHRW
jgi:hypothetical protein